MARVEDGCRFPLRDVQPFLQGDCTPCPPLQFGWKGANRELTRAAHCPTNTSHPTWRSTRSIEVVFGRGRGES